MKYEKFNSPEEMLEFLQGACDLYNPENGAFVWLWNDAGSIAVDTLSAEDILEILPCKEEGESWSGYIPGGATIWDDPSYEDYDEGAETNLDYCREHYQEDWVDCDEYERSLLEEVTIYATNIKWDIDYDDYDDYDDSGDLPKEIKLPKGMIDGDEISDYLSDVTGYCHDGFAISVVFEKEQEEIER